MSYSNFLVTLIVLFSYFTCKAQEWKKYPYNPSASSLVSFPKDEGVHTGEPLEWWYTVGHLTGETTGKHYSYMLTYFNYPVAIFSGFRIFNLSNDDASKFYGETSAINFTTLAKDSVNLQVNVYKQGKESWTNKIDNNGKAIPFAYSISATSLTGALTLDYTSIKKPLILADSGYFYQGAKNYTYYYSQTGNDVKGTITIEGVTEKVKGTAWIDRQYGSFNPYEGEKYEWFCLQLSNGMDVNLFNIFTNDNRTPDTLSYKTMGVYVDEQKQYTTSHFNLERQKFRYTSDSVRCYSSKWRLTSSTNDVDLIIEAPHPNYEVVSPFRFYEGPVKISGSVNGQEVTGKGFAELLHTYAKPSVTFAAIPTMTSNIISWRLTNPDQARPVWYELSYSIDEQNFTPIAKALKDTSYLWSEAPAIKYRLQLLAYSIDTTLISTSYISVNPILTSLDKEGLMQNTFMNARDGMLDIQLKKQYDKIELRISDIQGRIFSNKYFQKGTSLLIPVGSLHSGFYVLQLTLDQEMQSFKFMID